MVPISSTSLARAFGSGARLYAVNTRYRRLDLSGYILAFLDERDLRVIPCLNRSWRQLMVPRCGLPRLMSEDYLPGSHDQYRIKRSLHRNEAEAILKQTGVEIPFPTGENFLEHYSLGKGAFGEFCIGYAMQKTHYVGIKITLGQRAVESEAKIQQALSKQPHIMPAIDTYKAINPNGKVAFYQVMDLAGLGSADKLPLAKLDKKFREHVLFCLADGLLQGLNEMHRQGFCHLDIKPENLAVKNDGTVRLIDFGCSAMMQSQMIDVREENGDSRYFSPERWLGCRAAKASQTNGPKIDAWAAGLTLLVLAMQADFKTEDMFIGMQDLLTSSNAEEVLHRYVRAQLTKISALKDPARDRYEALIVELLNPDPSKRLSPSKALDHPWCKRMRLEYSAQKEVICYLREFVQEQQRLRKLEPGKKTVVLSPQDLPLPHFTSFVERPDLQSQVEKALFSVGLTSFFTKTPVLACFGIGGVGKSRLLAYMIHNEKIQNHFGLRLWFRNVDNKELLIAQYVALAKELYLVDDSCSSAEAIKKVHEHLALYPKRFGKPWLIVFDHADEPEQLAPFIPQKGGYCVVTTRSLKWKEALPVGVLSQREGEALVKKLLLRTDPQSVDLCKEMCNHPLGIEQACALMRDQQMTISTYLEQFRKDASLIAKNVCLFGKELHHSVQSMWNTNFETIRKNSKEVYELLEILSFFASTNLTPQLLSACSVFSDVQNICKRYAILKLDVNGAYTIDRLIQLAMINRQETEKQVDTLSRSMKCFLQAFYSLSDLRTKNEGQLLAHGESLLKHFERLSSPKKLLAVSSFIKQLLIQQLSSLSNPTVTDSRGFNGLHGAVTDGNLIAIEVILFTHEHLLESRDTQYGRTPLLLAAGRGNCEAYEFLLKAGANSKATCNLGGNVLHHAALSRKKELVQLLAANKELLEARETQNGDTPLLLAAKVSHREVCEILIKAGANPKATNNLRQNALHKAVAGGRKELVQLFVEYKELLEARDKSDFTPLLLATYHGHRDACEILLNAGANPTATNNRGYNALHEAAQSGKAELVELLAANKAMLETRDTNDGNTPLLVAAKFGHCKAYEILLKAGANPQAINIFGHNALHIAARNGQVELVRLLAEKKELLEAIDITGKTPMLLAHEFGHQEACEILCKAGVSPLLSTNNYGRNALHIAAARGKVEVVQLLVANKQLLEKRDTDLWSTPLLFAVEFGHREVYEILLKAGANPRATNKHGQNALHRAVVKGKSELMQLLAADKKLLEESDKDGCKPLHLAAGFGRREACEILLKAGANSKTTYCSLGRNVLHYASVSGKPEVVQLFARDKELIEERDKNGETPLYLSARSGYREVCEILLKAGANPKATTYRFERNVLHYAAISGKTEVVQLILGDKELFEKRDENGDTPLHLAAGAGHREVCEILLKAGADPKTRNNLRRNVLHCAVDRGKKGVVQLFAENKALLKARDSAGYTPLLLAVHFRHHEIYEILFKANPKEHNPLYLAAVKGMIDVVRFLAKNKELLEKRNKNGNTPLLSAASGHREVCEILLESGANPKVINNNGCNALHLAAINGRVEVIRLLAKNKELLEERDIDGDTPFLSAAICGHREVCEILLQAGTNVKVTDFGLKILCSAARNAELVRLLFSSYRELLEASDPFKGSNPLFAAVESGHGEVCEILLKAGFDPKAPNDTGYNTLHYAVRSGKAELVELLTKNRELLEARDKNGNTPLLLAAQFGHRKVYEILLEAGVNTIATNNLGCSTLHLAVKEGRIELVPFIVRNKVLLETKDKNGNTPMLLAAEFSHGEMCEILLKAGAKPTVINNHGCNALHLAAQQGKTVVVSFLVENKVFLEGMDKNGNTPLLLAAERGHREVCEILLKAGANPKIANHFASNVLHLAAVGGKTEVIKLFAGDKDLLEARDLERRGTPLLLAAYCGHREACEVLLKAEANLKAVDNYGLNVLHMAGGYGSIELLQLFIGNLELLEGKDKDGKTPLFFAAECGHQAACEMFLKAGASPTAINNCGRNALHCAAAKGQSEVVQLLAKNQELLETRDVESESTPLLIAAYSGHREACERLLKAGANCKVLDSIGRNVLHNAAVSGKKEIVQLFIENKEFLEARDHYGDTPLLLAACFGDREACEMLLKAGANPKTANPLGRNVLHRAALSRKTEIVQLFAQNKELLEASDQNFDTPLLLAAQFGYGDVCEILLKMGADSSAKNKLGENAWQLAKRQNHKGIVRLLQDSDFIGR